MDTIKRLLKGDKKTRTAFLIISALLVIAIYAWGFSVKVSSFSKKSAAGNTPAGNQTESRTVSDKGGSSSSGTLTSGSDQADPESSSNEGPSDTQDAGSSDTDSIASSIMSEVKFDTELSETDKSIAIAMLSVSEDSNVSMYMGDGSFADTVIVVESKDEETAVKDERSIRAYLKDVKASFRDYEPKEAEKMNGAVIVRNGALTAAVVAGDKKGAAAAVKKALK
ncbi:MAG: DUF4358 domain-containing protein [Lachnospiraceae bacterium]|jgi:hypothetical protein|nr:DUF4358 domain-containing protein [Lachnospiraceae bacterium]MEE3460335.1 DUF4358 domain-containing protein [Lachnospiraceae bacterium]